MLSYSRRNLLGLLALPVLAGCGFAPIYAEGTQGRALLGKVALGDISDRMGFEMREQLELRFGKATDPHYRLDVQIEVESEGLAITPNASITRFNLSAVAYYSLTPIAGGDAILTDSVRSFTAYSATSSPYATRVAESDARRRLAVSMADQIATLIAAKAAEFPS
jgi:LPS-assembly lipoprotein